MSIVYRVPTDAEKARFDARLDLFDFGNYYQASDLDEMADYAEVAAALKDSDPERSFKYQGKSIGGLKASCRRYHKSGANAFEIAARGDGTRKTFQLRPNVRGKVSVVIGNLRALPIVRGQDRPGGPYPILRVLDASGEYVRSTDWRIPETSALYIEWVAGGRSPAPGATYTVEIAEMWWPPIGYFDAVSDTITLPTAPGANQFVFAAYLYDEPGLPYQQTYDGLGGAVSGTIDSTYTLRYLGSGVSRIIDALGDDIPADLLSESLALLVKWFDIKGYMTENWASNYGAGEYASDAATALCLRRRNHPEAARMVADVLMRRTRDLPELIGPAPSYKGGFWGEGFNYAKLAIKLLADTERNLFAAGLITSTPVLDWLPEVGLCLRHIRVGKGMLAGGGDWFPNPVEPEPAFYTETSVPLVNSTGLPLSYVAEGQALCVSRDNWGDDQVVVSTYAGWPMADHFNYDPGGFEVFWGGVWVVPRGAILLRDQSGARKSQYSNNLIIDCPDRTVQIYPRGMGVWYGAYHPFLKSFKDTGAETRAHVEAGVAYSSNAAPGMGGPCERLAREVIHLRAEKAVVVYDRAGVKNAAWPFDSQVCTGRTTPTRDGDWWMWTIEGKTAHATAIGLDLTPVPTFTQTSGVGFLHFGVSGQARGRIVTVIGLGHRPALSVTSNGLTVDGRAVALAAEYPPAIGAPLPSPPPSPPPPPPAPTWVEDSSVKIAEGPKSQTWVVTKVPGGT